MKPQYLKNVRFTDLTWAGAGPFGTKVFADFGADIIKIESTTRLDPVRAGGPFKDRKVGVNRSGYFASRNTGKKSVTVDLKSEQGRRLVLDLIRRSDVVSNNFGAGAMQSLGLDYDSVRAVKPDIIYLAMPMFGEDGPMAKMPGLGMTISAVTGLMWHTAYGPNDPVGPGTHYPDHAANPYHAAFAILAALRYRRRTGKGMKIDLAQVESTINFIGAAAVEYAAIGREHPQIGNATPGAAPHGIYPCAGEDRWCAIAVMSDQQWQGFARAIGRKELGTDSHFTTAEKRVNRRGELDRLTADWSLRLSPEAAVEAMFGEGVPAGVVASSRYLIESDRQLAARGYWQRVDHPELGKSLYASLPCLIDGERVELARPPLLGEHTRQVLQEILGMSHQDIKRLDKAGVLK